MDIPPIYIVSGGKGKSGEQLVRTALAQFPQVDVPVVIIRDVCQIEQLDEAVKQAAASRGIIVHTLVDENLRLALIDRARQANVVAIDPLGQLMLHLSQLIGQPPVGQPGLYRRRREDYFKRIEAIEFTVDHDDGRKPHELHLAEIVLTGVSRVGKTPLSMYLSTLGWKVANIPLIKEVPPPAQLFEIDPRRVVGLHLDAAQLIMYRERRKSSLGLPRQIPYTDLETIEEELRYARRIFLRGQFMVVDTTDKPIEESADEVIAHVTRQINT